MAHVVLTLLGTLLLAGCSSRIAHAVAPIALPGSCEASAIVRFGDGYLVGDNEVERSLYRYTEAMTALPELPLPSPVEDIEALVSADGGLFVVGSQGLNQSGKLKPERQRIVWIRGLEHRLILPDLSGCAACVAAAGLAPEQGGVNVEGATIAEGALVLGLRSPLTDNRAIFLTMDLSIQDPATTTRVTSTHTIDLGGRGVRDVIRVPEGFLILAGPSDGTNSKHALFQASTLDGPAVLVRGDLPEGSEGLIADAAGYLVVIDGSEKNGLCVEPSRFQRLSR